MARTDAPDLRHEWLYEIQSPLGAGGMGEVYRARDTRLDRAVAIKVIPTHLSDDPVRRQRFEREARAISALQHPNICTLYDVGHQDGTDYLVMEYLDGETLARRLDRGALPIEQTLRYGIEVADALDAAHRRGIVHRDLKPGNIMVTARGECKVLDFGLAKLGEEASGSRRRGDGYSPGSADQSRRGARHCCLHVARASARRRSGRAHGYLFFGHGAL